MYLAVFATLLFINFIVFVDATAQTTSTTDQAEKPPDEFTIWGSYTDRLIIIVEAGSTIFFAYTVLLMIQSNRQQKKDSKEWHEQTKLQVEELQNDAYQNLRDDHHDLLRLQMEQQDLLEVFDEVPKPKHAIYDDVLFNGEDDEKKLKGKDKLIYNFYVAEFDLYERVAYATRGVKKDDGDTEEIVTDWEWIAWLLYLEKMSHHWLFTLAYNNNTRIFDPDFMKQIKTHIIDQGKGAKDHLEKLAQEKYKEEFGQELQFPESVSTSWFTKN